MKLIKLIQNELIKIFKRKSIYILLFLSLVIIVIYNYINPTENGVINLTNTRDMSVVSIEKDLKEEKDIEEYVKTKAQYDFVNLYNSFEENSWQRYALNNEKVFTTVGNVITDMDHDIIPTLEIINDFENNENTAITQEEYNKNKKKFNEYKEALNENDWRKYVELKINNLQDLINSTNITEEDKKGIYVDIETYKLRLDNNVNFGNDIKNEYINMFRSNYYSLISNMKQNEDNYMNKLSIQNSKSNMNIAKFAVENDINQYISGYEKIDARISFIRTFENFNLIIIIVAIYVSCISITEEINKGTIKSLLIKPHKRTSVLIAKILANIITILIFMVFIIIVQYIAGGIIFGFESYDLPYISFNYNTDQIFTMNLFSYIIFVGVTKLPMYTIIVLFCTFMGVINNHTSMNMILTLIIFIISDTAIAEWSKFEGILFISRILITNNWDFSQYLFGQISPIKGLTPILSGVICLLYGILLLYITIHKFKNKDIVNV